MKISFDKDPSVTTLILAAEESYEKGLALFDGLQNDTDFLAFASAQTDLENILPLWDTVENVQDIREWVLASENTSDVALMIITPLRDDHESLPNGISILTLDRNSVGALSLEAHPEQDESASEYFVRIGAIAHQWGCSKTE